MKNTFAICCVSTALLLAPRIASAQCNNSTPTGAWGFSIQGFVNTGTTNVPFGDAGIIVFDGNGGITVNETISANGQIDAETLVGKYSVSSDCLFTLVFRGPPSDFFTGVFVNGGAEFRFVATQSGITATGSGKKISATSCNDASPAGSWGYTLQGYTAYSGFAAGYPPFADSGLMVFDGAGHLTLGDGITQASGAANYHVNSDCSFSMVIFGNPVFFYNGVFVNGMTEFFLVDTTGGNAVTGSGAFIPTQTTVFQ